MRDVRGSTQKCAFPHFNLEEEAKRHYRLRYGILCRDGVSQMAVAQKKNSIGSLPPEEAIGPGPKKTAKRERATIEFPYNDLENAVGIAKAVERAGGTACALDQLAAALGVTVSGPFRVRVSNARTFGLTENASGQVRLTELGRAVVDPPQEGWARVEAFLRVPLFNAIYERYKGYKLPGASGLETEINALGVSSKQTDKARQALIRSARQAGFFAHGDDRLVRPSLQGPGTRPLTNVEHTRDEESRRRDSGGNGGNGGGKDDLRTGHQELPYFVRGLLKSLPAEDTDWKSEDRVKWLEAAARCFDLMYGGGHGKISITLIKDEPKAD
jgi:hypothetical protein